MSGGLEWAAEHKEELDRREEDRKQKLSEELGKYTKDQLNNLIYAIQRDDIKSRYLFFKKKAKGMRVSKELKGLDCSTEELRKFLKYNRIF